MCKRILSVLSLLTVMLVMASCGAQKKGTSTSSGPTAAQWRSGIKGTWVLNSVTRENIPSTYTIKNIFDEAPVDCFVGSVWHLPTGNYKGSITFNSSGTLCANGAVRTIIWSVYNPVKEGGEPQFQFKKIYAGDKAANVTSGYRLDLSFADESSLVMKMPIPLDNGSTGYLVFNYTRSN